MRKNIFLLFAMAMVIVLGFHSDVLATGGSPDPTPDPTCSPDNLPAPTSGSFIMGTYTVGIDQDEGSTFGVDGYQVHVVLSRLGKTHLYSFPLERGETDLCTIAASDIKTYWVGLPCSLGVGADFGLAGTPVLKDVTIIKRDFCPEAGVGKLPMIMGTIVIRVVP